MARVTVTVTGCNHADRHVLGTAPGAAVANGLAFADLLHGDQPGFELHHRFETERPGTVLQQRRTAVEHDARPDPVEVTVRLRNDGAGIGHAALGIVFRSYFNKRFFLFVIYNIFWIICIREMRHEANVTHRRCGCQQLVDTVDVGNGYTEAVHAGIDLQPHVKRDVAGRSQQFSLPALVYHRLQIMVRTKPEVRCIVKALQHDQRPCDAGAPERNRLRRHCDRKGIGLIEVGGGGQHIVTVGIGLDHRHDLAARRIRPDPFQVVRQRGAIDVYPCGTLPVSQ